MKDDDSNEELVMSFTPVDLILVAHDGFRRDLADIDAAALSAARDGSDMSQTIKRLDFFTEMLSWHAQGEDRGVFPALENVAPDVAAPYEIDHRGLDLAAEGLAHAIDAGDAVRVARATAAFKFHLDMHLHKEEVHLYQLFTDRLSASDQADAVGVFTDALPRERFADFVGWLFPLVDVDGRARVVRVWQVAMPPQVFAGSMG
ncbi:MAG: hemerythrin domain-containing protein, partial [Nitrososphaerales archaeon]